MHPPTASGVPGKKKYLQKSREICGVWRWLKKLEWIRFSTANRDQADQAIHELGQCLLSTLAKMYLEFRRADVVEFKVAQARSVMALPTLNYSENLPPVRTSIPGLFAINSAQIVKGNLNVNETIQIGDECLEKYVYPELGRAKNKNLAPSR